MNARLPAKKFRPFGIPGPWTFDLYVARHFIAAYAVCTISFVGLFVVVEAFSKLDRFLRQDSPLVVSLMRYYVAMIPTVYATLIGPVLTLAAAMFAVTALNRQNELAPIKASGVSIYRVLLPIFVLALLLAGLTFYLQEGVIPRFKEPIRSALALARARPLTPPPYYDQENEYLISVQEYSTTTKIAHGVEIAERYPGGRPKRQIDAHRMEWIADEGVPEDREGYWLLYDASAQIWDENGNLVVNAAASEIGRLKMSFERLELETTLRPIDLETSDLDISYLSSGDLRRQFQRQPYHHHLAVKLHHHFAFPFSHIILLLIGLPFVLHFDNRSVFRSLVVCFLVCALFFLTNSLCMSIASTWSLFSPVLAAWLPVLLFGSLGITLFDHLPS